MSEYCHVLIVDDELLVRQGIKHHLNWEEVGFRIVGEAANGEEALAKIGELRPHIVLTDIVMPVMDGEELTRIIKRNYPEIEVIVLSSFSEFTYVRSSFQSGVADYILKPSLESQELLRVLKNTADRIPGLRLQTPPAGGSASIDSFIEKAAAGYPVPDDPGLWVEALPYGGMRLLGCLLPSAGQGESAAADRLAAMAERELRTQLVSYVCHRVPAPGLLVLLVNAEEGALGGLSSTAKTLADACRGQEPGTVWAVSEPFGSFGQLGTVYRGEFLRLLQQYRFFFPEAGCLAKSMLPSRPAALPEFEVGRYTEELKRGQTDSAFRRLREYAAAFIEDYETDVFELKAFFVNLIFHTTSALGEAGIDVKRLDEEKYAYFKGIDEAPSARAVLGLLDAFLEEAGTCGEPRVDANMKRLLAYIHEHYSEPLTLSEVAKHFHFNPSYLSSYFASNSKEGFNEYVNRIRIEEAAKLLRTGDVAISDIGARVGYADHSYFCKVFKKFTGMSPSRYRKNHT
ncbi:MULTISPECIES: response regulator transcription factor [Paenibacillus]|uniref:response regulator transcription factor n=1 Tax=Paenibacillus TaxID=44249 RepID=UPI0022B89524|nr:response regulator transcription factor [Paenibacillus caseinilyticus]MCZ8518440.1 response regulator transcription factor [Paenibacillus caseinilyticus]